MDRFKQFYFRLTFKLFFDFPSRFRAFFRFKFLLGPTMLYYENPLFFKFILGFVVFFNFSLNLDLVNYLFLVFFTSIFFRRKVNFAFFIGFSVGLFFFLLSFYGSIHYVLLRFILTITLISIVHAFLIWYRARVS